MQKMNPVSCTFLTATQIQKLQTINILTFIEFVNVPMDIICSTLGINETSYANIRKHMLECIQLAEQEVTRQTSTGIQCMDKMLGGGLFPGDIIELYGQTGTGKSLLSLYLTSRVCHFNGSDQHVIYFDLKNDFNASRLYKFCNKSDESMARVHVLRPSSYDLLTSKLDDIKNCVSEGTNEAYCRSKLMILDSVPMVIYPVVKEELFSWRFHQEKLLEKIGWLAEHLNLTVILINHAVVVEVPPDHGNPSVSLAQPVLKPAMGKYWTHKINTRIQLTKFDGDFYAVLEKSSRTSPGQKLKFGLIDDGNNLSGE